MYTKVARHITSRILGEVRMGHEHTWFSNIIYSAPPEFMCACDYGKRVNT